MPYRSRWKETEACHIITSEKEAEAHHIIRKKDTAACHIFTKKVDSRSIRPLHKEGGGKDALEKSNAIMLSNKIMHSNKTLIRVVSSENRDKDTASSALPPDHKSEQHRLKV